MDANCSLCVCSSVSLYGRVKDNVKSVVQDAAIYLDSRPYDPISRTNELGFFNVSNVCIMNEMILVVKEGYESISITPNEVSSTHWTINGTLIKTGKLIVKSQKSSLQELNSYPTIYYISPLVIHY